MFVTTNVQFEVGGTGPVYSHWIVAFEQVTRLETFEKRMVWVSPDIWTTVKRREAEGKKKIPRGRTMRPVPRGQ